MKVLLSWLREFAPLVGEPEELANQLTDLGMELESIQLIGGSLQGICVAQVLEIRPHPDADKICLVDVDLGDGEALQICCGATNMAVGDLVPLATIGTMMPSGMLIAQRKMRGQQSNGMLCSAREMEIGEDHEGILILDPNLSLGQPIVDALELREDVVFEFDALPNRPDTLSVMGVARDLAARQGVAFSIPAHQPATMGESAASLGSIQILAPDLCGSFLTRVISGVRLQQSPRWMAQRLIAAGMRPINNVVDVSNYVMLELGHPNHTYDLAKVPAGELRVRWANEGEQIVTLDGMTRSLTSQDGVIVDATDAAIGIAGVMGGASTEISETTTDVLLELAWWNPEVVAATSTRLNLHSEASLRFKRGVDTELATQAANRFAELLTQISGAELHPDEIKAEGNLPQPHKVSVRLNKVNGLLGTALTAEQVADLINPIGYLTQGPDSLSAECELLVQIPSWRPDSLIEVDVIEEVARQYGMERIPKTLPVSPHTGQLTERQTDRRCLRRALIGAGLIEAMPVPFLAPGDLERAGLPADGLLLANPLVAEESVLRTSLLPGLLKAVAYNASHRQNNVEFYELGRVFNLGERVIADPAESAEADRVLAGETEHLAVVLAGSEASIAVELLQVVLSSVHRLEFGSETQALQLETAQLPGLHPGRSASVLLGTTKVGEVGEVHPEVLRAYGIEQPAAWLQINLDLLFEFPSLVAQARLVSRFPTSDMDLAFVVAEEVTASSVLSTIRKSTPSEGESAWVATQVELFDVFRSDQLGVGLKSLAFRLRFQAQDRTLTEEEVTEVRIQVISEVEQKHGGYLRS
ncbi:MAG: phenylalanine--tRNA ligase subunit beta [Microthrixaceae bacterium]